MTGDVELIEARRGEAGRVSYGLSLPPCAQNPSSRVPAPGQAATRHMCSTDGFGPISIQSRSEDRHDARTGRRLCHRRNRAEVPTDPKLLEGWRGEWRARGELAFPGIGRCRAVVPALDDSHRVSELERKIGQLTMENDFFQKKALQHFKVYHPPAFVNGADVC
jgi:hypothetical protein